MIGYWQSGGTLLGAGDCILWEVRNLVLRRPGAANSTTADGGGTPGSTRKNGDWTGAGLSLTGANTGTLNVSVTGPRRGAMAAGVAWFADLRVWSQTP